MLFAAQGVDVDLYAGFRDEPYRVDAFSAACRSVHIATDSGRHGHHGFVTDLLDPAKYTAVCTCGPEIMMEKVAKMCLRAGVRVYVSREAKMACGVGAWLGSLWFTAGTGNDSLYTRLVERFDPLFTTQKNLQPNLYPKDHNVVDFYVFGAVPLEIYKRNHDPKYLELGMKYADGQWELPENPQHYKQLSEAKKYHDEEDAALPATAEFHAIVIAFGRKNTTTKATRGRRASGSTTCS